MRKLFFLAVGVVAFCACATPGTYVGTALFAQTQQPVMATNAIGTKTGRACGKNILGLFISGDMSIEAAKRDGNINQVATVDTDIKSYAIYAEVCTVVTGR